MKTKIWLVAALFMFFPMSAKAEDTYLSADIVASCEKYGEEYGICPELLEAMIERESTGNQYAENGSCKGLMQISERWHKDRMEKLGITDIYDVDSNIHLGADYISELAETYGEVCLVLAIYHGESNALTNEERGIVSPYASSILERSAELEREHEQMKQPKRLTREQKVVLSSHNMKPDEWLFIADIGSYYKVVHKQTGRIKLVDKYYKRKEENV